MNLKYKIVSEMDWINYF